MEQIICKDLKFTYPNSEKPALDGINMTVEKGEFIVICGKSGCGKTTLLRHMKKSVAPVGEKEGKVLFNGEEIENIDDRISASKIGYVMQNPESQAVTDKVWHELAFGLENLGYDTAAIRLKIAEMAAYFGMSSWFNKKIEQLSGGQKQLLNLASVTVMNPEIIILDEPTSQLDPVAAGNFLATVSKINRDLGVTVIITEHRLEEVFGYADRVIVMDNGKITADCPPEEISIKMNELSHFVRISMPASVRIHSALGGEGKSPLTVNEGTKWISDVFKEQPTHRRIEKDDFKSEGIALKIKNLFFRYERNGDNILENLSLEVPMGCIFAITGSNGVGKSTLLRILSGELKPVSGKIKAFNGNLKKNSFDILALPQNVQTLFTKKSVLEELEEMGESKEKIDEIAKLTKVSHLLERHPYDISGGEQQRTALAKILLKNPRILLLDEPTKGMDNEFKEIFSCILKKLRSEGKTVILISHDIEFCALSADFCAMLFDKTVVCTQTANKFFSDNFFYTTTANKMSRHIFENCVTDKDVISLCKKNLKL